jgi:transglutaminase-like putative cysteine protease
MPRQPIAAGLVVMMVVSAFTSTGCGRSPAVAATQAAASSAAAPAVAVARPQPASPVDVRDAGTRLAALAPPSAFDVDRKATELGNDVPRLFGFVRDDVRTQIYAGVLRGARGTLIANAGNAWDKATLLAALLRHHGREVRFARGRLGADRAAALVTKMFDEAGRQRPVPAIALPDGVTAQAKAMQARIESRWRAAQADLLSALDRGGVALGRSAPVADSVLIEEAADHAWVEYRDGDRWIALDPAAAAQPGETATTAVETFAKVPDALQHRVTFRVKVEERRNQSLRERDAFVWTTTAAALHGANVLLANRTDRTPLGRWLATPTLFVDDQAYAALSFTDAGLDLSVGPGAIVTDASRQVQGVDAISGMFGQPPAPVSQPPVGGELTAVSLEVEFTDPSGRSDVVRRSLLDRLGTAARAARKEGTAPAAPFTVTANIPLELTGYYACAVTSGALDPSLVAGHIASSLGVVNDSLSPEKRAAAADNRLPPDAQARLERTAGNLPAVLQGTAQAVHLLSQRLARRIVSPGGTLLWYEATPRLVVVSLDPTAAAPSIDLRRNPLRLIARNVAGDVIVRANLARGVLDGVIEDAVVESSLAGVQKAVSVSTVAILERAREQHIPVVTRSDGQQMTVLPETAPSIAGTSRSAWWRVDPATGETIGVLDNGLHGAQSWAEQRAIQREIDAAAARAIGDAAKAQQSYAAAYAAGYRAGADAGLLAGGIIAAVMAVLALAVVAFIGSRD